MLTVPATLTAGPRGSMGEEVHIELQGSVPWPVASRWSEAMSAAARRASLLPGVEAALRAAGCTVGDEADRAKLERINLRPRSATEEAMRDALATSTGWLSIAHAPDGADELLTAQRIQPHATRLTPHGAEPWDLAEGDAS